MEFRNCVISEQDPLGRNAMERVCAAAAQCGIDVVKTIPAHLKESIRNDPSSRRSVSQCFVAEVHGGEFCTEISLKPGKAVRVVKAFYDGGAVCDVTGQVQCRLELDATPYLCGTFSKDGKLLLYVEFETDVIDYAYEKIEQCIERHLSLYDGLPLKGFALDEFGAGTRAEHVYHTGEWFLKRFSAAYGYNFLDVLYQMDTNTPGAAKVRHDYYALTHRITHAFQNTVRICFEKKFGKDLFIGFHHTWWGEGNSGDLWAGNIDYFGLTDVLSGGFVDAQYDAQRTMLSMTQLCESLAKQSDTGLAYNMCWDRFPTHEKMDYYHRYLAARNVRWIGHGYGRTGPFGPGYPHHSTWADAGVCTGREKKMQAFYQGAVSKPKVAFLYLWEGLAYYNDHSIHYHRLGMKALFEKMQLAGIEMDVISNLENCGEEYDVLFISWGAMLPCGMMDRIESLAEQGKQIIFIGTPVFCDTDGADLSARFTSLTGCRAEKPIPYTETYEYNACDLWFTTETIPMQVFPLKLQSAKATVTSGTAVCGVVRGNVSFYSFEVALTEAFDNIIASLDRYKNPGAGAGVLSKTAFGDDFQLLCLCGIWDQVIDSSFSFAGHSVALSNTNFVGIQIFDDGTICIAGQKNGVILIDGKKIVPNIIV